MVYFGEPGKLHGKVFGTVCPAWKASRRYDIAVRCYSAQGRASELNIQMENQRMSVVPENETQTKIRQAFIKKMRDEETSAEPTPKLPHTNAGFIAKTVQTVKDSIPKSPASIGPL